MEQSTPPPPPEDPTAPATDITEFLEHRPRLFSLAYRMFGAASEAEDVVQEVY
ncbi:sigma factor, partial [Nocardia sp. NPDC060220]|uniref:sigma factor n=1 Tax=Nocardia sp. NPDC060220 TaxID=3347076 RepID=UPI003646116B